MKISIKILIVLAVAVAAAATIILKTNEQPAASASSEARALLVGADINQSQPAPVATAKLPKLLDLGADKCIPCRMMFPVLDSLKKEYAGRLDVEFIDVWKHPDAAKAHGVEVIPTQIFYNADDKELFRHEGFFAKDNILAKWRELGVNLAKP